MSSMEVTIEKATFDNFKEIVDLCRSLEDWENAYEDYQVYMEACGEENMNFLAAKNEAGKMIGFAALLKFPSNTAALGAYIILPDYRSQGIGPKLFDKLIEDSVREGRNIGLLAEMKMAEKYEIRYGFDKRASFDIDILVITNVRISQPEIEHWKKEIVGPDEIELKKLIEFDHAVTRIGERAAFVKAWTSHPVGQAKVAIDLDGKIVGYAVARLCHEKLLVIAPIYAADDTVARKLFLSLVPEHFSGRVKVFTSNKKTESWKRMLNEVAQVEIDCTVDVRFTKAAPEIDIDRFYGMSDAVMGIL
uniref:N-acetyltransferase domain-containing protein n=1 Tax=Plectus sambesii TaxID=2011161 RepID=A0A914WRN5_9BILA